MSQDCKLILKRVLCFGQFFLAETVIELAFRQGWRLSLTPNIIIYDHCDCDISFVITNARGIKLSGVITLYKWQSFLSLKYYRYPAQSTSIWKTAFWKSQSVSREILSNYIFTLGPYRGRQRHSRRSSLSDVSCSKFISPFSHPTWMSMPLLLLSTIISIKRTHADLTRSSTCLTSFSIIMLLHAIKYPEVPYFQSLMRTT